MRAAAFAAEQGRGGAFVLAAGRLAFCGGFDLDDPEILAEAAAAAGIRLDECLRAAGDARRDGAMEAAGRRLLAAGADRLPVLRIGRSLFWGEQRVGAAAAAVRQRAPRSRAGRRLAYGLTSPARICAFIASTVSGRSASSGHRRERPSTCGRTR